MFFFMRLLICLVGIGLSLYMTVVSDNHLTRLRMQIPKFTQEVRELEETNETLAFSIASLLQPHRLFSLALSPSFSHLQPSYTPSLICPMDSEKEML